MADNEQQAGREPEGLPGGDGEVSAWFGLERSIRPGTGVPPTVVVAYLGNGSFVLHGWPEGRCAYLTAEEAAGLRQELDNAFGGEEAAQVRGDLGWSL